MGTRGRKSAASLNVVQPDFVKSTPPPPDSLTERQAMIWEKTVRSEPDGHFKTAALQRLLENYCQHSASADELSEFINEFKIEWLKSAEGAKRYRDLLKMRDGETKASADKATKLRLTNQSRYTPQAAATAAARNAGPPKPWEE